MKYYAFILVVSAVFLRADPAAAGLITITDKASFNSQITTALVDDFAGFPTVTQAPSITFNGNTYTGLNAPNVAVVRGNAGFFSHITVGPIPAFFVSANGNEDFTIDFGIPRNAIGFDTSLNGFGPATVRVFGATGLLGTITHTHNSNTVGFLGIIADEPIQQIRWTTIGGASVNTGIANIIQGTTTLAPEPSAFFLFVTGFATLFIFGRNTGRAQT